MVCTASPAHSDHVAKQRRGPRGGAPGCWVISAPFSTRRAGLLKTALRARYLPRGLASFAPFVGEGGSRGSLKADTRPPARPSPENRPVAPPRRRRQDLPEGQDPHVGGRRRPRTRRPSVPLFQGTTQAGLAKLPGQPRRVYRRDHPHGYPRLLDRVQTSAHLYATGTVPARCLKGARAESPPTALRSGRRHLGVRLRLGRQDTSTRSPTPKGTSRAIPTATGTCRPGGVPGFRRHGLPL